MSDHVRAAQVIVPALCNHIEDFDVEEDADRSLVDAITQALDAAGLLASPEYDAEIAAKALRDAAEEFYGDDRAAGPYSHPLSGASWLRECADHIEREGGAS